MTTLEKKPCKLTHVNLRGQKDGAETVPAVDITLDGIMLTRDEVDELAGDHWWTSHYNERGPGKPPEHAFPEIGSYKLDGKHIGTAIIMLGLNQADVVLDDEATTIKNIQLEPMFGGLTKMKLRVQSAQKVESFVHRLAARLDSEVDVEISIGEKIEVEKSRQGQLGINAPPAEPSSGEVIDGCAPISDADAGQAQADALARSREPTPAEQKAAKKSRGNGRPAAH